MRNSPSSSSSYQNRVSSATFFAAMLRRLLFCSNSLPPPLPSTHDFHATPAPCLVARLMGLDSLPPPPLRSPTTSPASSLTKSWSMNSLEFRRLTESSPQGSLHTSLSFREEPTYVELQDDHFFILSFEKAKFRSKRGPKLGYRKLKQSNKEEGGGKGGKKKTPEIESDFEHWSPVSVLDMDELGTSTTTTTSSDLSTPVNEAEESDCNNFQDLSSRNFKLLVTSPRINLIMSSLHSGQKGRGRKPNSKWGKKRKIWNEEIRRISEEEISQSSRWDYKEASTKLHEFEEIGDHITGILLRELLEEMNEWNSQELTKHTLMMMI